MSKRKGIEKEFHKLFQAKDLDQMLWSAIRNVRNVIPSASIEEACKNFQDTFNLTDEQWPIDSMKVTYHRLNETIIKTKLWKQEL